MVTNGAERNMKKEFKVISGNDKFEIHGVLWEAKEPSAVMIIVHGFGEHSGRYENMAKHIIKNNISVVTFDLRGHGKAVGPKGVCNDYSLMANDITEVIQMSQNINSELPHFIYGHSMGGGLALHNGLFNNDMICGYLVSAPLLRPSKPIGAVLKSIVKFMNFVNPNGAISNKITGDQISTIIEEQNNYENDPLNHSRLGTGLAIAMIEMGEKILANRQSWAKDLCIWHSKIDKLTEYAATEKFVSEAQNTSFISLDNVEHETHNDTSRQKIYKLIISFIKERSE